MTLIERVASERRAEEIVARAFATALRRSVEIVAVGGPTPEEREALALEIWNAPGPNIDRR